MKNSTKIAEVINPHDVMTTDGRYSIDSPTLALIIDPVSIDDLSTDYQCQVYATNPITGTRKQLQFYPPLTSSVRLSLTLTVKANIGN